MRLFVSLTTIAAACSLLIVTACETNRRAKELMAEYKCLDCHTFKGAGGSVGPNLTSVGGRRNRDFIYQQIKDPKSHNPRTDMPSFGARMSENDLNVLADYLSSLK